MSSHAQILNSNSKFCDNTLFCENVLSVLCGGFPIILFSLIWTGRCMLCKLLQYYELKRSRSGQLTHTSTISLPSSVKGKSSTPGFGIHKRFSSCDLVPRDCQVSNSRCLIFSAHPFHVATLATPWVYRLFIL